MQREIGGLQSQEKVLQSSLSSLQAELLGSKSMLMDVTHQLNASTAHGTELGLKLKNEEQKVKNGEQALQQLQENTDALNQFLESTKQSLTASIVKCNATQLTVNKLEVQVAEQRGQLSLGTQREEALNGLLGDTKQALETKCTAYASLEEVLSEVKAEMNQTVADLNAKLAQLQREIATKQQQIANIETNLHEEIGKLASEKACSQRLSDRLEQETKKGEELTQNIHAMEVERKAVQMANTAQVTSLQQELAALQATLKDTQAAQAVTQQELAVCLERCKNLESDTSFQYNELKSKSEKEMQHCYTTILSHELSVEKITADKLAMENKLLREQQEVQGELERVKQLLAAAEARGSALQLEVDGIPALKQSLHEEEMKGIFLDERLLASEQTRRQLHNDIQDLRGTIRVAVRVRPLLQSDVTRSSSSSSSNMQLEAEEQIVVEQSDPVILCKDSGSEIEIVACAGTGTTDKKAKSHKFEFNEVFPSFAGQEQVFEEVSHLIQSALDGYSVCLFSYGQTGSGKTYTMQGGEGAQQGIIPRAVAKVLQVLCIVITVVSSVICICHRLHFYIYMSLHLLYLSFYSPFLQVGQSLGKQGWQYEMTVGFMEIYNETIRDLLVATTSASKGKKGGKDKEKGEGNAAKLEVKSTGEIPGLTMLPVQTAGQIQAILQQANKNRTTASTQMNACSSRSHSIFTMHLVGTHTAKNGVKTVLEGNLNLCDLAGSERLDRSGAGEDPIRLKETQCINKSLSSLADVFVALQEKQNHIPYRNSTLTQVLQRSLGGQGPSPSSICSFLFFLFCFLFCLFLSLFRFFLPSLRFFFLSFLFLLPCSSSSLCSFKKIYVYCFTDC